MNNVIFQLPYQSTTEYKDTTDHSSAMTQDDTSMPTVITVQISLTGKISAKMSTESISSLTTPILTSLQTWGWSGGAMVLAYLPVPGRPTIWFTVGKGLLRLQ